MRHATDPDHVVAVSTIVARHRSVRSAAVIGALWGLGHTLTLLLVGSAIVWLGWVIPPRVGLSMEFAVGVMLIVLGATTLSTGFAAARAAVPTTPPEGGGQAQAPRPHHGASAEGHHHNHAHAHVHSHAHAHGDYVHTHPHDHEPERHPHDPQRTPVTWLDSHLGGLRPYQLMRPLVVGVVHGLAGSAAVALLVLAAITDTRWALLYLAIFGIGTVAGMLLITTLLSVPFAALGDRFSSVQRGLRLTTGVVSLVFGVVLAYRIGVTHGLFIGQPTWTPR